MDKQERKCQAVGKIATSKTFNDIVEIDLEGYGDKVDFHRLQDAFPTYSIIALIGAQKQEEQTDDKVIDAVLTHWVAFFGTPSG